MMSRWSSYRGKRVGVSSWYSDSKWLIMISTIQMILKVTAHVILIDIAIPLDRHNIGHNPSQHLVVFLMLPFVLGT